MHCSLCSKQGPQCPECRLAGLLQTLYCTILQFHGKCLCRSLESSEGGGGVHQDIAVFKQALESLEARLNPDVKPSLSGVTTRGLLTSQHSIAKVPPLPSCSVDNRHTMYPSSSFQWGISCVLHLAAAVYASMCHDGCPGCTAPWKPCSCVLCQLSCPQETQQ